MKKMKCCMPNCDKEIPEWRKKKGLISCSKKCVNAWNHLSTTIREKVRGRKYKKRK